MDAGSMTNMVPEIEGGASKAPFFKKHRLKLAVVAFLVLCYFVPLLGYLWRLGESVVEHGVSRQTLTDFDHHTDWFIRYFTGPMSDAEMIAFFSKYRSEFERMAYIGTNKSRCDEDDECSKIAAKLGLRVGFASLPNYPNYACQLLPQPKGYGQQFCASQEYYLNIEPQNWWRSRNDSVEAWEKSYIYVAPTLPAERFGLNSKDFPSTPIEIIRHDCYLVGAIDVIPSYLNVNPDGANDCAARQIDGQWFLSLFPHVKNTKN